MRLLAATAFLPHAVPAVCVRVSSCLAAGFCVAAAAIIERFERMREVLRDLFMFVSDLE